MDGFFDLIQKRQSCRSFETRPVERQLLDRLIEAAQLAPSACNAQPWRFVVVDEPQRCAQLAKCLQETGMNKFTDNCPAFIVVIEGDQNLSARFGSAMKDQKYAANDIGIASAHLVLAATELGLGSCIIGWHNERKIKILLGIPKTRRVRLVIALGYAAEDEAMREKQRKPLAEICSYNKY